jgi:hypothetical protein
MLPVYWSGPPDMSSVPCVRREQRARVPACIQGHRQLPLGNRSPPKCLANASASSCSAKQNTTTSLSSRRMAYVSGVADRKPAAQNITSLFTGSRAFSARSAT